MAGTDNPHGWTPDRVAGFIPPQPVAAHRHDANEVVQITDHGALTGLADDDHPQYETGTEVQARISTHEGAADPHPTYETSSEAAAKITTHEAAADPHTGYLQESVVSGFATPALSLGTANAAGNTTTAIRSNSTIAAFDAISPVTQAFGDNAAVGTAGFAARRDHKHAMPANPVTAHEAAADPHTGYQRESEKDQNSGYVGLAAAQGTRDGTKFLRDDGVWAAPSGSLKTLGYAERTAQQTGITTEVALTGLTVDVTVPAGARVQITASLLVQSSVATDEIGLRIKEDGTLIQWAFLNCSAANRDHTLQRSVVRSPTTGAHTYALTLARTTGTGTVIMDAGAQYPAFILVENIT